MKPAVIFDIDGTLSDPTHRLHHVIGAKRDWPAFFGGIQDDGVNESIRWLLWKLDQTVAIIIVTGRPENYRAQTEAWLAQHMIEYENLYMRPADDTRPDYVIKSQILDGIIADGYDIKLTVDDRQQVVDMWRERGLTCLQCKEDHADKIAASDYGELTLMVGPSGAGKTTYLRNLGVDESSIVSSDRIRAELCGDFKDQTKNDKVFKALHAIVKTRIEHGIPAIVDATNIRNKDRLEIVKLAGDVGAVRYIVIDRPMAEKRATAGWRAELPIDLLAKHDQTFQSNLKAILAGDDQPNVTVVDLRSGALPRAA